MSIRLILSLAVILAGMNWPVIKIECPPWVEEVVELDRVYENDERRMQLAVMLSRENIRRGTGGPFGAAVFEVGSGRLLAVGVNLVVPLNNCTLHGEMVAFMMAQARLRSWTLAGEGMPRHELYTSCEPCAMCLGATLWSGVKRLVCAATREDALQLNFDEGPVFAESYLYLEKRGIEIRRGLLRAEARDVLEEYRQQHGTIYNG